MHAFLDESVHPIMRQIVTSNPAVPVKGADHELRFLRGELCRFLLHEPDGLGSTVDINSPRGEQLVVHLLVSRTEGVSHLGYLPASRQGGFVLRPLQLVGGLHCAHTIFIFILNLLY